MFFVFFLHEAGLPVVSARSQNIKTACMYGGENMEERKIFLKKKYKNYYFCKYCIFVMNGINYKTCNYEL